jgi:hypothetical protein
MQNYPSVTLSFMIISKAFGQTFTQTDITVFKQNLQSLEDLNSKRKLYQKVRKIHFEGIFFSLMFYTNAWHARGTSIFPRNVSRAPRTGAKQQDKALGTRLMY